MSPHASFLDTFRQVGTLGMTHALGHPEFCRRQSIEGCEKGGFNYSLVTVH